MMTRKLPFNNLVLYFSKRTLHWNFQFYIKIKVIGRFKTLLRNWFLQSFRLGVNLLISSPLNSQHSLCISFFNNVPRRSGQRLVLRSTERLKPHANQRRLFYLTRHHSSSSLLSPINTLVLPILPSSSFSVVSRKRKQQTEPMKIG